jgi:hypothetical protein
MSFKHKLTFFLVVVMIIATLLTFGLTANANIESTEIITNGESSEDYSALIQDLFKDDPLRYDAAIYASYYGVTLNEGLRRLELQITIGEMDGELTENEVETFSGLWIEHEPEFKVVALFTGNGEETIKPYLRPGFSNIVEVRNAETSLAELVKIQEEATLSIEELGLNVESEVNVYENRVKIYVLDWEELDAMVKSGVLELSQKVDVIKINHPSTECIDVYGGMPLSTCTCGFGVVDSGGTRGLSTAEHCNNNQVYNGTAALTYIYGTDGQYYDIQWHTVPNGYSVTNEIQYDDDLYRQITSTQSRNNQSVGTIVYKYGKMTGQTVGQIVSKTFDPGWFYTATFIRVDNIYEGEFIIQKGDSGGPWFVNNTAYGSSVGGIGPGTPPDDNKFYDAYYMAVNYFSGGAGVNVLTTP